MDALRLRRSFREPKGRPAVVSEERASGARERRAMTADSGGPEASGETEPALGDGPMTWLPSQEGVLAFDRGTGVTCVANLSGGPIGPPPHAEVLLASGPLTGGQLPSGTTVWLRAGS